MAEEIPMTTGHPKNCVRKPVIIKIHVQRGVILIVIALMIVPIIRSANARQHIIKLAIRLSERRVSELPVTANIKNVAIYAPDMITPRTISPPAMSRVIAVRAATAPNIKHGVTSARAAIWIAAMWSASAAAVPMTAALIISNAAAR